MSDRTKSEKQRLLAVWFPVSPVLNQPSLALSLCLIPSLSLSLSLSPSPSPSPSPFLSLSRGGDSQHLLAHDSITRLEPPLSVKRLLGRLLPKEILFEHRRTPHLLQRWHRTDSQDQKVWHIPDIQGQSLALAFRSKSMKPFQVFRVRWGKTLFEHGQPPHLPSERKHLDSPESKG